MPRVSNRPPCALVCSSVPLNKREQLEIVSAYYKISESRVRKRIFEMVKAVGAASHAEVLGGRKGR